MAVKASVNNQNQTTVRVGQQNAIRVGSTSVSGKDTATTAVNVIGGRADVTQLEVSGLSTFTGIGTFVSDLYVGGDLYLTDDLVLDNISGSSLDISGISSVGFITATDVWVSGAVTATTYYGDGTKLTGIAKTGGNIEFSNIDVTGITTTSVLKVGTAITASGGIITATRYYGDGTKLTGVAVIGGNNTFSNIDVTGITTTSVLKVGTAITASGGIITATTFSGSGANLNSIPNSALDNNSVSYGGVSVDLGSSDDTPAFDLSDAYLEWVLDASGTDHYIFTGPGLIGAENDPTIYLKRGQKYRFKNASGGHPFRIQSSFKNTSGIAYDEGITNNPADNGTTLEWHVQFDAPDVLYYQCTQHTNMSGKIYIDNVDPDYSTIGNLDVTGITTVGFITATDVLVSGAVTATSYYGDGTRLTGIAKTGGDIEFSNIDVTGITTTSTLKVGTDISISGGISTLGVTSATDLESQNLNVTGITTVGFATATDVWVSGAVTATSFYGSINSANILRYSSGFTASAGVAVGIDTFPKDSYDSAEYVLYFKLGTDIQSQKLLVMDNGTVAYSNEYAIMYHENQLVDLSCTVSASNIIVNATPVAGISGALTYVWQRSTLSL